MKKLVYSVLLVAVAMLSSCSDFLVENPKSNIPEEEAYKSAKLLYINTVGSVVSNIGDLFKGMTDAYCTVNDMSGGEVFCPGRGGGDWQDNGKHQAFFTLTAGDGSQYLSSVWNGTFGKISAINKAIETIELYYDDSLVKDELKGYITELRTLRAIYYFYMMDFFGSVPICKSTAQTITETVQSSRAEVYDFVKSELLECLPLLNNAKCQDASDKYYGRMTKAIGYYMVARLALNTPVFTSDVKNFASTNSPKQINDFVSAAGKNAKFTLDGKTMNAWETVVYCQEQVAKLGYGLQPKFTDNFATNNDSNGNIENIFVIPRDNTNNKINDMDLQRTRHANHGSYEGMPGCWNGISGTRQTAFRFGYEFDGDTEYDPRWPDTFYFGFPAGEANKSKIKSNYKYVPGDQDPDGIADQAEFGYYYVHRAYSDQDKGLINSGVDSKSSVFMIYQKWGGARYKKYMGDPTATSGQNISNADFAIFRYADLLLMSGEAKYRNGGDGSAEINAVRARVGAPAVDPSDKANLVADKYLYAAGLDIDVTMQFIAEERTRELAWEGFARPDEIRFGNFTRPTIDRSPEVEPFVESYGRFKPDTDGHSIIFPIPLTALQANPQLKQNPGY